MSINSDTIVKEPLWTKDFIAIVCANLFIFIGFQMLLPVLPVYATTLGGSEASVGLVVGIFTLSAVVMRPFAGNWLDRYGRKGVYLGGLAVFLLSVISYHFVPTILLLLILRFIHGAGWGASSTASGTIASDIIPKSRLGEGMGFFGVTNSLSMAVAPAIGLSLMEWYGFHTVFNVSTACIMLAILIAFMISYHKPDPNAPRVKSSLLEKKAVLPAILILFVTMTYGGVVAFIALYAAERGVANIGLFFTFYALSLMVSRPTFGRLSDRKGYFGIVVTGILAVIFTMVALYFADSLIDFLFAGVIYGLGFGAVQPSLQAMAVRSVPPNRRGAANATYFVGFDLGIGSGSILWGAVAAVTSYQVIYLLSIIPAAIALLLYLGINKARPCLLN